MADLCSVFREYLVSVKMASPNTVESYMRDIHQYSEYCTSNGRDTETADSALIKK